MQWQAQNPQRNEYISDEALGLQVLRVTGREDLWPDFLDEAAQLEMARKLAEPLPEAYFANPFILKDMQKAVDCLLPIIEAKGRILIHGDYDCDGITATALLWRFLSAYGVQVSYYIPDRLSEGYGLSEPGVAHALKLQPDALITVDCGVQSFSEVEELKAAGIRVVISDHHVCLAELPIADAVINPNRLDEGEQYRILAGAGVALKLCQALNRSLPEPGLWMRGLQFAALGTVADQMLLCGENRHIVQAGLLDLSARPFSGPAALLQALKLDVKQVRARSLAFSVAPRINACGRMGSVEPAMRLMLSDQPSECAEQAALVENINLERRRVEDQVFIEALNFFSQHPHHLQSKILFVHGRDWHPGVLGIVAARLMTYFNRPIIIVSNDENGIYKGSARSLSGVDILSYIQKCETYLMGYGGHRAAAGLQMTAEQLASFQQALQSVAEQIDLSQTESDTGYTLKLKPEDLRLNLVDSLDVLEPFGNGNEEPEFFLASAEILELREVGKDKSHLRIVLNGSAQQARVNAIAFGEAQRLPELMASGQVDLLAKLQRSDFNNNSSLDLLVQDLKPSVGANTVKQTEPLWRELLRLQRLFPMWSGSQLAAPFATDKDKLIPQAEDLKYVYRKLLASGIDTAPLIIDDSTLEEVAKGLETANPDTAPFVVYICLMMYEEASLLCSLEWNSQPNDGRFMRCYNLQKTAHKVNLYDTKSYLRMSQ